MSVTQRVIFLSPVLSPAAFSALREGRNATNGGIARRTHCLTFGMSCQSWSLPRHRIAERRVGMCPSFDRVSVHGPWISGESQDNPLKLSTTSPLATVSKVLTICTTQDWLTDEGSVRQRRSQCPASTGWLWFRMGVVGPLPMIVESIEQGVLTSPGQNGHIPGADLVLEQQLLRRR